MNLNTKEGENCRRASDEEEQLGGEMKKHFHILAVDDSHIDRKLLERLLTISSYQVTCVESGDKALEYLGLQIDNTNTHEKDQIDECGTSASSSPNLSHQNQVSKVAVNMIMTDYSMPGISGYDLLKRVKDSSWKDIPVVVMSSEDIPSRINMCLESGAEEFLLKPVKLSDLSKLQSHLQMNSMSTNTTSTTNEDEMNHSNVTTTVTVEKNVKSSKCNSCNTASSSTIIHSSKMMIRKVTTANILQLFRT